MCLLVWICLSLLIDYCLQFAAYQAKGGKVTAVATMQRDPIVSKASELMRLDLMPPLEEIKKGKDILQIELINKGQK